LSIALILGLTLGLYWRFNVPEGNLNFWDVLRLVDLSLAVLILSAISLVLPTYFIAWRKSPKKMGLLPKHVWLISTSYFLVVVSAGINNIARIGSSFSGFSLLNFVAFSIGVYALYTILEFERKRITTVEERDQSVLE
jgi:hypothetical protein